MITLENIKEVLLSLGYTESGDKYTYHFDEFDCNIEVDFRNNKIIYPEDKGLVVNERQACNFSNKENFVVLECIHRLLLKGYKPSHIEIEKRWTLGHSQKSGRADICLMNETGSDMLAIIECKTYGAEFENELKNLKAHGGQLFSYYQQEQSTKWLMLYATGFIDNKIEHQSNTISVFDTEEVLEKFAKNKSIKLYDDAHSKEKAFEVWKETYEQKIYGDLIFADDTIAYNIGKKPLRKKDLKEFNPKDKIVNKFEEILRHNNVSDKENAFNKLVALFICKLVDEIIKQDDDIVDFQYKFGTDTYETLLDRLQRLYKEGMDKFMKEEIFYVSSEYPLALFSSYKGRNRKNAINDLKETFRKLKFYSNSDFAFKDVHNEELFLQNGKILVEVVKLFENYKIVYSSKHQFLGDLFEQLLNQGFKQNEGQFFTPIPITRFIWECLPIENIAKNLKGDKYPKIIDYACGSGHFLTEGIETINSVIKSDNNDWVGEKIYGVEKDYRLARVSKISLFMNGAGSGNIIFGDGLDSHKDKGVTNNSFDILVANPPYSVKAFKSHLKLKENSFELTECISNDGDEIEVLFVERIAQLLKANAIAAVILPSSILSNSQNSYIGARESILKNFKLRAITQFGNKTFGATGTNTVVLFIQKYNEPPKYFKLIEDNVNSIFNNEISNDWQDNEILSDYLDHIGVDSDRYIQFLNEINYEDFLNDKYFKMYVDEFIKSTDFKNMISKKTFNNLSEDEKNKKKNTAFYSKVKEIEREKLFYFALVREQKTLVIKAPSENKEQTQFLGYEWSNRKGNEGIQIKNEGGLLYNPNDKNSEKHIAPLIKKSFSDKTVEINEELKTYVNIIETKNMLDFSREKFDRVISLVEKTVINIITKYPIKKLQMISDINYGVRIRKVDIEEEIFPVYGGGGETFKYQTYNRENQYIISRFGMSQQCVRYVKGKFFLNDSGLTVNKNTEEIKQKYLDLYLYSIQNKIFALGRGSAQKNLDIERFRNLDIPVPPIEIQEKIIKECEELEKQYETTRMKIEEYQAQIQKIFEDLEALKSEGGYKTLVEVCKEIYAGGDIPKEDFSKIKTPKYNVPIFTNGTNENALYGYTNKARTIETAITISARGTIGFSEKREAPFYPAVRLIVAVPNNNVNIDFLNYTLKNIDIKNKVSSGSVIPQLTVPMIQGLKIYVPTLEYQEKIVNKVKNIEREIAILKEQQINLNEEINKIVQTYIN
ncbi:N-6 DNA methylase [Mesomycoplasma ovipneumoniae]|uniref:N-6 DNA methylase n=1 Tax=Mesomycoplasma ovipneumoniae TaxID=29562 RepID=UPI0039F4F32B